MRTDRGATRTALLAALSKENAVGMDVQDVLRRCALAALASSVAPSPTQVYGGHGRGALWASLSLVNSSATAVQGLHLVRTAASVCCGLSPDAAAADPHTVWEPLDGYRSSSVDGLAITEWPKAVNNRG